MLILLLGVQLLLRWNIFLYHISSFPVPVTRLLANWLFGGWDRHQVWEGIWTRQVILAVCSPFSTGGHLAERMFLWICHRTYSPYPLTWTCALFYFLLKEKKKLEGNTEFVPVKITRCFILRLDVYGLAVIKSPLKNENQVYNCSLPWTSSFMFWGLRYIMGGFCFAFTVLQAQDEPWPMLLQEGRNRCGNSRFYIHISKTTHHFCKNAWSGHNLVTHCW